jgi:hypothetical protein
MAQADYVTNAIPSLITAASAEPSTNPVRGAYAELLAGRAGHPSRPIRLKPHVVDLEDRADHLNEVFNALWACLTAISDDTAQNIPGGLDLCQIGGALQYTVKRMAWRAA